MDKNIIHQIAAEVVAQLPIGHPYWMHLYLFINLLIVAAVAGIAAWVGSFLKTKGQNFATKQDFDELHRQLKINTETVETIKSEVSQRDRAQREWTNLRRIKLEGLLEKMHECEAYLDRCADALICGRMVPQERDLASELLAISSLHFPELEPQVHRFFETYGKHLITGHNFEMARALAGKDQQARQNAIDTFRQDWAANLNERLDSRIDLIAAARSLLKRIMNVDERPAE
jgi:hypothetical protein